MGLVCSTGGELPISGPVVGCPVCDNRPSEQATWAEQFQVSQERLQHLARWNEQAPFFSTFEGLVDYLTGQTTSDVERFWVLFHWIQLECRRHEQTHKPQSEDSPWGFLRAVQNRTRSHAELYKKLCRTAHLKCKIVSGLCKSIADTSEEASVTGGASKSSWNEVTINGRRGLVDCGLELDFEQIRIPPFYFLSQPTHFATAHFPDNKSHQLLEVNITLEQFQGHVNCFPHFFGLEKDAIENHSGDVSTNDGIAVLKLGTTKPVKCCLQSSDRITVQSRFDLSKHVKQLRTSVDGQVAIIVRPPFLGRYKLKVWLQDEKSDTLLPVCRYTIVCGKVAKDCSPFKSDAESHQRTYQRKKKNRTSTSSQEPTKPTRPSSITWSDEPVASPGKSRSARRRLQKDKYSDQVSSEVAPTENMPPVEGNADYPKTYKAWTRECVLYRPKARTLSKGALVKFKLAVPHINRLAVLLPFSEDGYKKVPLKSRDGGTTWKGKARVPNGDDAERRYVFVVGTPNGTTEGQYLLEYDIGDRNPPEGESMEDHDNDLKLHDLRDSRLKPLPDGFTYHIMISYSWAQQEVIIKVKEHLNKVGYRVWLDKDEMGGTMLESMARGVRSSAIVIIAFSEDYVISDNCKREANFASDQKREIVPLKMTTYYPDNWLGMLISGKYYVDFSSPGPLDDKLKELEFQIENRLKKLAQ
ncbi:uncharacterized protein LOC118410346 [Branchiostoma floridae]|uniref:Uncharacterized protein LOC118410346 n=1 Tax=Branchiostoma floridae TaxID=7739 RepID=A0A9J7KPP4_BRAFL|nr:uncharacterized protein LOC118410346 [Branchiostoma floridae]